MNSSLVIESMYCQEMHNTTHLWGEIGAMGAQECGLVTVVTQVCAVWYVPLPPTSAVREPARERRVAVPAGPDPRTCGSGALRRLRYVRYGLAEVRLGTAEVRKPHKRVGPCCRAALRQRAGAQLGVELCHLASVREKPKIPTSSWRYCALVDSVQMVALRW